MNLRDFLNEGGSCTKFIVVMLDYLSLINNRLGAKVNIFFFCELTFLESIWYALSLIHI